MKKLPLIATLTLLSFCCVAQITISEKEKPLTLVGKVASMGVFLADLSYKINPEDVKDTVYSLRFKNQKYSKITAIETVKFAGIDNTDKQLYTILKSVFLDENKKNKEYSVSFKLGNDAVVVKNYRELGTNVAVFMNETGFVYLKESQIDRLFGK